MKNFWKFLLIKDLPSDSLENVQFTVFGLGDSGYQKFNAMARKVYQRLLQLGAKEFHERGLGDDQHEFGYDGEFIPWLNKLWEKLKQIFPNKNYDFKEGDQPPVPQYLVRKINNQEEAKFERYSSLKDYKKSFCYNKEVILGKITNNAKMTKDDAVREVRYVEIETQDQSKLSYQPGDVAVILPRNDPVLCQELAKLLGYNYDDLIEITLNPEHKSKQHFFPKSIVSIRELFEFWLRVAEPPSRYFFKLLSYFTTDELHKEKLQELGRNTNESKIEYNKYCWREKRNVYEILFDFHTVKLPLNYFLEGVGLQKTREYSISTSNLLHPSSVSISHRKIIILVWIDCGPN